jgi:16S rRNA (cytosine967-C5)-methyltransferase
LAAFRILLRVLQEESYATELLHSLGTQSLDKKDLRLTTELVFGVLRQQMLVDSVLALHSKTAVHRLDAEVLVALRLATYQILFLDRVPPRAALFESVELVKAARLRSAAGYVNAVLRKIRKTDIEQVLNAFAAGSKAALAVRYSHPEWLVRRWLERFGRNRAMQLLERDNQVPSLYFRANAPGLCRESLAKELQGEVAFNAHPLSEDVFEVTSGDITRTSLFNERRIAIQDAGSQLIPHLLELKSTDVCLDLCAGHGGKTSQMARLKASPSTIMAADLHWHRLRLAREMHAGSWREIRWVVCDGTQPLPVSIQFEKVLLDAPCSGSGTLQRHPEIRWRIDPEQVANFPSLQTALLESAFQQLKPNGRLVYSTCSLEQEENEGVVDAFLRSHSEAALVCPAPSWVARHSDSRGLITLFPPETRTDGFFAALLTKSSEARP